MPQIDACFPTLLVLLQLGGLLGVLLTRITGCPRKLRYSQLFFFVWMAFTGIGTLAVVQLGCQVWLPMGATLAVTALCATLDTGTAQVKAPF